MKIACVNHLFTVDTMKRNDDFLISLVSRFERGLINIQRYVVRNGVRIPLDVSIESCCKSGTIKEPSIII